MTIQCRHDIKNSFPPNDNIEKINNTNTHIITSYAAPEKKFEPWNLIDSLTETKYHSNGNPFNQFTHNAQCFSRNYQWNEIEQNEDELKRFNRLLSIWDAERIAILKLQHELDKNIFKRTIDYFKRICQSIGLGLWLWVHRPANCSNISDQYHFQQSSLNPVTNISNVSCENTNFPQIEEISRSSIEALPDSLWLKHFVLDEPQECLPPIARAMKNMLDNNVIILNSTIENESIWPHFINHQRIEQDKRFHRNLHENNQYRLPTSYKIFESKITNEKTDSMDRKPTNRRSNFISKSIKHILNKIITMPASEPKKNGSLSSMSQAELVKEPESKRKPKKLRKNNRSVSKRKRKRLSSSSKSKRRRLRRQLKSNRKQTRSRSRSRRRRKLRSRSSKSKRRRKPQSSSSRNKRRK